MQDALTATVEQLLVSLNGPLAETPDTVAAVVPVLVTVTDSAEVVEPTRVLGKDSPPGATVSIGPGNVPVPDRATVVGLFAALSVTVRLPVSAPATVGEYVTLAVHEPFAAIDDPQVLVSAKSPVAAIDETVTAALVGLETVTVCAEVVVPVKAEPKVSELGSAVKPGGGGAVTGPAGGQLPQNCGPVRRPGVLPPPSVTAKPPPQLYTRSGWSTLVAVTLVNVAAPWACSCMAKVPAPLMVTSFSDTPLTVPSTHWTASKGLSSISALVTLIGPVTEPCSPSNHSAPTPNCQFGSSWPSRIMVLLLTVVRPTGVEPKRCATVMPPPWLMPVSSTRLPVTVLLLPP